jgi:hypothetical protein
MAQFSRKILFFSIVAWRIKTKLFIGMVQRESQTVKRVCKAISEKVFLEI